MLWITENLALPLLVLNCLLQCPAPTQSAAQRNEIKSASKKTTKTKNELTVTPKVKVSSIRSKEFARPTAKPAIPTKKVTTAKKITTPTPLNEFSLNEILFRGRQSNEANAFIKANEQRGKTLETTYEHIREQDMNDIEALVRTRKGSTRFTRY